MRNSPNSAQRCCAVTGGRGPASRRAPPRPVSPPGVSGGAGILGKLPGPSSAHRLSEILEREKPQAVITHAYEGGHPDHDAAAFAVHAACRLMGEPPAILEMALYHRRDGQLVSGEFLPWPGSRVFCATIALNGEEIRRKQRMIDCFATQR